MKVLVIEGEMAGEEIPLTGSFSYIGREEGSEIQLPLDFSVSRRHAVIRKEFNRYILEDLDSTNGTFVVRDNAEDEEVMHAILTDGMRFRIGKTLIQAIISEKEIEIETTEHDALEVISDTPDDYAIRSSIDLEEVYHTSFLSIPEDKRQFDELNRKIQLFYELGQALGKIMELDQLLDKITDHVFRMFPAQRGYLMLLNTKTNELETKVVRREVSLKDTNEMEKIEVSKTIINTVLREKKAILSDDARIDERFGMPDSVFLHDIRASLYAPLMYERKPIGIICIDSYTSSHVFTENDLRLLTIIANQAAISIENSRLHQSLRRLFFNSIRALANAIEARDPYTRGHSDRVTGYSVRIAEKMKMSTVEIEKIRCAALLHDIGKINIKEDILNKPGKLTEEEYDIMSQHPVFGAKIMEPVEEFKEMLPYMYHHHERFSAGGYPEGLKGEDIPMASRILSVADAFDAMTSDRPYRKALSISHAIEELEQNAGTQFDPKVVSVFKDILFNETDRIDRIMHLGMVKKEALKASGGEVSSFYAELASISIDGVPDITDITDVSDVKVPDASDEINNEPVITSGLPPDPIDKYRMEANEDPYGSDAAHSSDDIFGR
ncbi:MAG: HD domain-containing protein [Candidatus Eremiobacteraeota bacterium]|nr:HD domain-containing protein [Candidatus Eremiobacteraeota bacterium]